MPKLITSPTAPWFARSDLILERTIAVSASPFSGKYRTQEFDAVYWHGTATLPSMNRTQAREWQAFLLNLVGIKNYFLFIDPDATTPQGTYDGGYLKGNIRVNGGTAVTSAVLTFSGNAITCTTSVFGNLAIGDFITTSGAVNAENNTTHKVTAVTSASSISVDTALTTESSTAACKVRQNIKGSTALSLEASSNAYAGTLKKGDYIAVYDGAATTSSRVQLLMVTEDATETTQSGSPNHFSVRTEPKLRQDLTDTHLVGFSSLYNKSQFRLSTNAAQWNANEISLYGITIPFIEVI